MTTATKGIAMHYLILIASDETANPRPGSPEFDTWMAG